MTRAEAKASKAINPTVALMTGPVTAQEAVVKQKAPEIGWRKAGKPGEGRDEDQTLKQHNKLIRSDFTLRLY